MLNQRIIRSLESTTSRGHTSRVFRRYRSAMAMTQQNIIATEEPVHYSAGGLAAALQAFEHLHNGTSQKVVYSTDGQLSIMDRSGLQGHEHPTQFDEYGFLDLFSALKDNVYDSRMPETTSYRSLAMPMGFNFETARALPVYTKFFAEFCKQKLMAGSDVTEISKAAVRKQKKSLANFDTIDKLTRASLGKAIMERHGRCYFAFEQDLPKLMKGLDTWTKLGIECHMVDDHFLRTRTLLDMDNVSQLGHIHAYFMPNDSYFNADIIETLVQYMEKHFPEQFTFQGKAALSNIVIDEATNAATVIEEVVDGEVIQRKVSSVFTSLGHDQIRDADCASGTTEYKEIMATSSTGDWVQSITKAQVEARLEGTGVTPDEFLQKSNLIPYADKYNLHVTPLSVEENGDYYNIYYRVTEGGILSYESANSAYHKGSNVSCEGDLVNTLYKVNNMAIGTWKPLTVGSCTRKIDANNTRQEKKLADNVIVSYNASGTGVVDAAHRLNLA